MSPQLHKVYGSPEDLPLRELLAVLLGPDGRRKLMLRHKTNDELALAIACKIPLDKLAQLDTPYSPAVGGDQARWTVRELMNKAIVASHVPGH